MSDQSEKSSQGEFRSLITNGIILVVVWFVAFIGIYVYVVILGNGGADVYSEVSPLCFFPFIIVSSIYVGYFMAKFSKNKGKHPWLWAIIGFVTTVGFIVVLPIIVSGIFPGISILFAFLAPVLSTLLTILLINIRRKPPKLT